MLASDRVEFDRQVSVLCAAYNVPVGDRGEAYWQAFNRLSLAQVARIVEQVIGPEGPDKFPTVKQLWGIRRAGVGGDRRATAFSGSQEQHYAMVEACIERFHPCPEQLVAKWDWHRDQDMQLVGVTIPAAGGKASHYLAVIDL